METFFTLKNSLPLNVSPQQFSNNIYWMLFPDFDNKKVFCSNSLKNRDLLPYMDNDNEIIDCSELELLEDSFDVNYTDSGKYTSEFYVPKVLRSIIIGSKGSKLQKLQQETNTFIKVPRSDDFKGYVKICGNHEKNVVKARSLIALLLLNKREKMAVTHFISIPLISDEIISNFIKFRDSIINISSLSGLDKSLFQNPNKLHLTLTTLTLLDNREIEVVKMLFKNYEENIKKLLKREKKPIYIILQGIEIMNDDPRDVNIVYGKVNICNNLQILINEMNEYFFRNGFVKRQFDNVKLHVTLLNSSFRKESKKSFDANYILNNYKDYYFGKSLLSNINLSIRFSTGEDYYYDSLITITI